VAGKAWTFTVPSEELTALKQRHLVSGAVRRSDGVSVRVVAAEAPARDALLAEPGLEDAYLWHVTRARAAA